jgi:hypothetical protein
MPNKLLKLENNKMILTPCVRYDSKLVKSANMTPQIFFSKHFVMGIKKRIIEKSVKIHTKKLLS